VKEVSILIPNKESYLALELCIESIRHFTRYPNYKIIVCDDYSTNKVDLEYLRKVRDKGWLDLYENPKHLSHGGTLNRLLNEICDTDLAMVVDCDIQIMRPGWLEDMVKAISVHDNIIAVVDVMYKYLTPKYYRVPTFNWWFGIMNMKAYRDNMQVDWKNKRVDRRDEPFKTIFADHHPPTSPNIDKEHWDENRVEIDPGGKSWLKINYHNPKGYKVIPLPVFMKYKYRHFFHITCISFSDFDDSPRVLAERNAKFVLIKNELAKLRENG